MQLAPNNTLVTSFEGLPQRWSFNLGEEDKKNEWKYFDISIFSWRSEEFDSFELNFHYISSIMEQLRVIRRTRIETLDGVEIGNKSSNRCDSKPDLTCNTCNELHREISWKDGVLTCSKLTRSQGKIFSIYVDRNFWQDGKSIGNKSI